MSFRQTHPIVQEDNDYQLGLKSIQAFHDMRQSRNQTREPTIQLHTPKNAYGQLISPKPSLFMSQRYQIDEIENENITNNTKNISKIRFQIAVRRLKIILQFYRESKKQQSQKLLLNQPFKRKSWIPIFPDNQFIIIWSYLINLIQFIAVILYPPYIGFQASNSIDTLSVIILLLDSFFFLDLIMDQITCKVDQNYNTITSVREIFMYNLRRWLLFDLISILPYKLMMFNSEDNSTSLDYWNLFKLLKVIKYFIYKEQNHYKQLHSNDNDNQTISISFDITLYVNAKLLSILQIFKGMLLLINVFGCLWYMAGKYDDQNNEDQSRPNIYIDSLYWAMQTVTVIGYGDIISHTSIEYNLTIMWIFVGVGFYSFTIGNLAQILDEQDTQEAFQSELEQIDDLFSTVILPDELQNMIFSFFYYNIENNPFWNFRKIFEELPTNLQTYTITFCQKSLIQNIKFLQMNINFAASILPQFGIYNYKQYETIYYIGSPSLDIYFLVAGEVRLCDSEGNTLLNILEGHVFGEIEVLDDSNRRQHAIASADSVVVICPIQIFIDKIKPDEELSFEIEQLGLRRKLLVKENNQTLKKHARLRRKSALKQNDTNCEVSPFLQKKINLEKAFKHNIIKETFPELQKRLLHFIFGKKTENKWKIRAIFTMAVRKVIDSQRLKQNQMTYRRRSTVFNKKLMKNFQQQCKQEQKLMLKLIKHKSGAQQLLPIKQIFQTKRISIRPTLFLKLSPYSEKIINESIIEKQQQKQKEEEQLILSKRLLKFNLASQMQIIEMYLNELQFETYKLQESIEQSLNQQYSVDDEIYSIQCLIQQIIQ